MGAVGRVIDDHVAEDHAAKRPKDETDGGAAHEVRLQQVARLMQLAEIGAAPGNACVGPPRAQGGGRPQCASRSRRRGGESRAVASWSTSCERASQAPPRAVKLQPGVGLAAAVPWSYNGTEESPGSAERDAG